MKAQFQLVRLVTKLSVPRKTPVPALSTLNWTRRDELAELPQMQKSMIPNYNMDGECVLLRQFDDIDL